MVTFVGELTHDLRDKALDINLNLPAIALRALEVKDSYHCNLNQIKRDEGRRRSRHYPIAMLVNGGVIIKPQLTPAPSSEHQQGN